MKKMFLTCSILFAAVGVACADVDRPIEVEKLPDAAQKFLKQYFSQAGVSLAKEDVEEEDPYTVAIEREVQTAVFSAAIILLTFTLLCGVLLWPEVKKSPMLTLGAKE